MHTYEVIVGNIGSVYLSKSRAKAIGTYESYVEIGKEHDGARCYGEDVTLLVDGEVEQRARGASVP